MPVLVDGRRDPLDPRRHVSPVEVREIGRHSVELAGEFFTLRAHLDELGVRYMPAKAHRDRLLIQQGDADRVLDHLAGHGHEIRYTL